MWTTIQDKRIGIIGFGHIGGFIAKFLKTFGCSIIGFKRTRPEILPDFVDEISSDLIYTVKNSDIFFVTLPLTDKTKNLINADVLNLMNGKYLINVGRGDTVNEDALYNSLKSGELAGAALDAWYNYPGKQTEPVLPAHIPIYELPNVLCSPHKSSHTIEAINAMIDDTIENVRSYIRSGKPKNIAETW